VKTLHPKVHGGLLGRRGIDDLAMTEQGIHPIDLLVANLYPFEQMATTVADMEQLTEYIDIGGSAMIRAAAKNYRDVAVITAPEDYPWVTAVLEQGGFSYEERFSLAKKAFARTAAYDAAISNHFQTVGRDLPEIITLQFRNGRQLRYGENPHQKAAFYAEQRVSAVEPDTGITLAELLWGKEGMPRDANERAALAVELIYAANQLGIPNEDIWIDPIASPVSVEINQVKACVEFMSMLGDIAPGCKSTVGLSNVSNGTPAHLRPYLNRTYLIMLMRYGLHSAIVDAFDSELVKIARGQMPESGRQKAEDRERNVEGR
jgi:hypothetical protein